MEGVGKYIRNARHRAEYTNKKGGCDIRGYRGSMLQHRLGECSKFGEV